VRQRPWVVSRVPREARTRWPSHRPWPASSAGATSAARPGHPRQAGP